jgi:general secretion pathway protein D
MLYLCGGEWKMAFAQTMVTQSKPCFPQWKSSFKVNFPGDELLDVVDWISKRTCYNFILSTNIRAQKITILSERAVNLRQIYQAFLSVLEVSNITVVREGNFMKLVVSQTAAQESIRTYTKGPFKHANLSEMVTYLVRVQYIDINNLANVLNQLSPAAGRRITLPQSGVIILIDYANNIHRLLKIIKALDVEEAEERDRMFLMQVENGQAPEIVQKVQAIFQIMNLTQSRALRLQGRPVDDTHRLSKILADDRTNRIILVGSYKAYLNAANLIKKLDLPMVDGGMIRVHHLRYAKAEEIAQTLSQLATGAGPRPQVARPVGAQSTELFQGEIRISADKSTNSLVIVSNQRDFDSLMRVIQQLDVRRKQVFVETVILEVSMDKSREIGAAFHGGAIAGSDTQNPDVALFGTNLGGLNSLILDPAALMGLALGLRGPEIPNTSGLLGPNVPGIPSFGVILRAIQTNSDVDLLSSPHILTTANEEASIQVGQNVPFIAGTSFSSAGLGMSFPVRNIQRQDVALTLKIKPQINAGDRIRLELDLEITEIAAQDPELGPTTTKRQVKTTVRVRDNQTVVIGGLMRDRVSEGVSKVPFLGDIPLIGSLFRVKSRKIEKRNLLIFLTPHIILHPVDFQRIFHEKMRERQQFLREFHLARSTDKLQTHKYHDVKYQQGLIDRLIHRKDIPLRKTKTTAPPANGSKNKPTAPPANGSKNKPTAPPANGSKNKPTAPGRTST